MLPRMFTPVQLNVDCSAKTPVKEPEPKKGRKGKSGKAQGGTKTARPSSAGGRGATAGKPALDKGTRQRKRNGKSYAYVEQDLDKQ